MKVGYFTERPARWVPEDVILRNGGHFAVSNSYFDRERAAEDYNYFIDENLYAEELGFDIIGLNEHHGNPFCMGSVMNVEAGILARLTKKARILLDRQPAAGDQASAADGRGAGRDRSDFARAHDHRMGARRGQRAVLQQRESRPTIASCSRKRTILSCRRGRGRGRGATRASIFITGT